MGGETDRAACLSHPDKLSLHCWERETGQTLRRPGSSSWRPATAQPTPGSDKEAFPTVPTSPLEVVLPVGLLLAESGRLKIKEHIYNQKCTASALTQVKCTTENYDHKELFQTSQNSTGNLDHNLKNSQFQKSFSTVLWTTFQTHGKKS